jgi:hypothetical protein
MSDPLYLVQGDTGPQIKVTLTREDTGLAENLTGATVSLHFKKKGTSTVLFTLTGQNTPEEEVLGEAYFVFSNGQLNLDPGNYQGEVEVVFQLGARETVYEIIQFVLREDFA